MIDRFGADIWFIQLGTTPDDPSQPWNGTTTTRSSPDDQVKTRGCFVDPATMGYWIKHDEELLRSQKIVLVSPALTVTADLEKFDEIKDSDGIYWKITKAMVVKPATVPVLYIFGVKR